MYLSLYHDDDDDDENILKFGDGDVFLLHLVIPTHIWGVALFRKLSWENVNNNVTGIIKAWNDPSLRQLSMKDYYNSLEILTSLIKNHGVKGLTVFKPRRYDATLISPLLCF